MKAPSAPRIASVLALVGALMLPDIAAGYDFVPTDHEFASWPPWCKAVYLSTDVGQLSKFVGMVDHEQSMAARREYNGFWHYCAGIAWLSRAQLNLDRNRALWEYRQAINETMFNYLRAPPTHKLRGEMSMTLGLAYRGLEDWVRSIDYLERAIAEAPAYTPAYSALAIVYRERKNLPKALAILLQGIKRTSGNSAELHYLAGLVTLELGDVAAARSHADLAYSQGYPLPGLKKKLAQLAKK